MANKLRYEDIVDDLNVDAIEEAIGFTPEYDRDGNDVGFCIWPENHTNGDTTGKFAINREKKVYNCYVCGGGSLLSLAMETQGLDVDDAIHWLAKFTIEDMRTDEAFITEFLSSFEDVKKRVASLPYFNERVLDNYEPMGEGGPEQLYEWAMKRGIHYHHLHRYNIRFSDSIQRRAPKKFADDGDYIGPGIVFPHYWKGRLVGWQTRWLDEQRPDWIPKYTNTTDFPKDSTLYGMDQCNIEGPVIIVESVPSVIWLDHEGFGAVATFGSSINPAQIRLLRRYQDGVILAPDNDKAGEHWLSSLQDQLKDFIPVYTLPYLTEYGEGSDVGDIGSDPDLPGWTQRSNALMHYVAQAKQLGVDL